MATTENNIAESQMPAGHKRSSMKEKCAHTIYVNHCRGSGHDSFVTWNPRFASNKFTTKKKMTVITVANFPSNVLWIY